MILGSLNGYKYIGLCTSDAPVDCETIHYETRKTLV